jgi:hypothetical protein
MVLALAKVRRNVHRVKSRHRRATPEDDRLAGLGDRDMVTPIIIELLELKMLSDSKLELSGTLNSDSAQAELSNHFRSIHARLAKTKSSAVEVDLRGLKLANSSAIRLFVDWISSAAAAGYKLVFHVDRNITWHRLSFDVLQSLAPETVQVVGLATLPPSQGRIPV